MDGYGDCAREGCDEPCPWDMPAIILGELLCCSPDCARTVLETVSRRPADVTLHDPQYRVDRDDLAGVNEDAVDIGRTVHTEGEAEEAIDALAQLHSSPFRVS